MENRQLLSLGMMNERVSDVLKANPQLVSVFIKNRVACVRCCFSSFCNLQDVINTYDLEPVEFLRDISEKIEPGVHVNQLN